MAANKFATMVHKNTNKLTLVLVYVVLEWTLIAMLLLNAMFSFLILRFSDFFGLETPCIICSRIDHMFDARKKKGFQLDLLCKAHVSEISESGFCSSDKKLGEFEKFCENCSKIHMESEPIEMVKSTKKENSIIEFDRFEESNEVVETQFGCSILEINSGVIERVPIEGSELNFETIIEDPIQLDNPIENKIEECDDRNCDKFAVFESLETKENQQSSLLFQTKNCDFVGVQSASDSLTGEAYQMTMNESEEDVSIGTEIPDIESIDEFHRQEIQVKEDDHGIKLLEEDFVELKTISIDAQNIETTQGLELNNVAEEKIPDTPSSIESLHQLYKSISFLKKKELGAEESFDGSVVSELEGGEVTSVEHLVSVLTAERKALNDLYKELEEERNASAIAANQTMAMINRLQEEKAAMQMEALHYQRMMEEQSQYDQEALVFLNELIVKRENEKHELEKELEVYRNKVLENERKNNLKMMENGSNCPSFCSSNCGDSEEDSFNEEKRGQTTPIGAILSFDESSDKFEEERLFILQQLKHLEEKLFTLADDDEEQEQEHFEVIKPINHIYGENGNHMDKQNGISNGFTKEMNGKQEVVRMGNMGRNLLPLFDAVANGHVNSFISDKLQNSITEEIELGNRNLRIEEEFDRLYDRLQALEADKEFLKHCIGSLRKGDKGVDLLQEISRNLRNLRL